MAPLAADRETFYPCLDEDRIAAVQTAYGVPDAEYILTLNSPDPRKNVPHAIQAFVRFVEQERASDIVFVLARNAVPGFDDVTRIVERLPSRLRERVVVVGWVADGDLAALYSGALAFVYPSIYESFGLPALEAMQCGTPVIASDTSSLPEVVGDAGLRVAPTDLDALAGALRDVHRDRSLRAQLREKSLAQAARFSWDCTTRRILGAYRAALAS